MFLTRPTSLILIMVCFFWVTVCFAQDKIYRSGMAQPSVGKISKVDDEKVYVDVEGGSQSFKRAEVLKVEVSVLPEYASGIADFQKGNHEGAIKNFKIIHDRYYGLPQAWIEESSIKLGQSYLRRKNWPEAQKVFSTFKTFGEKSPFLPSALAGEGYAAYGMEKFDDAIKMLTPVLESKAKELFVSSEQSMGLAQACLVVGKSLAKKEKLASALDYLLRVPTLYSADPETLAEAELASAQIYIRLKKEPRAKAVLDSMISEFPPESSLVKEAKALRETLETKVPKEP